jgi:hypothetical protein
MLENTLELCYNRYESLGIEYLWELCIENVCNAIRRWDRMTPLFDANCTSADWMPSTFIAWQDIFAHFWLSLSISWVGAGIVIAFPQPRSIINVIAAIPKNCSKHRSASVSTDHGTENAIIKSHRENLKRNSATPSSIVKMPGWRSLPWLPDFPTESANLRERGIDFCRSCRKNRPQLRSLSERDKDTFSNGFGWCCRLPHQNKATRESTPANWRDPTARTLDEIIIIDGEPGRTTAN